jgi:hypothetical protein
VNTISKRAVTREAIESGMEAVLFDKAKANVQIAMLGENAWSIDGSPKDVCKAFTFLEKSNLVKLDGWPVLSGNNLSIHFKTGA